MKYLVQERQSLRATQARFH